jgi:hypothetical protein
MRLTDGQARGNAPRAFVHATLVDGQAPSLWDNLSHWIKEQRQDWTTCNATIAEPDEQQQGSGRCASQEGFKNEPADEVQRTDWALAEYVPNGWP